MSHAARALFVVWAAANPAPQQTASSPAAADAEDQDVADLTPNRGAAASPIELVPRLEIRQSYARVGSQLSLHDTTAEIDIQFLDRVLLRYEGTLRVAAAPSGQTSGFGDLRLQAIGIVASAPRYIAGVILGAVLDTASQPALGAGKQQVFFGAGGTFKPLRWWLPYLLVQDQLSVGGDDKRPDVHQLAVDAGNLVFGKGQTWYKLDLVTVADFTVEAGRFFGTVEVGRLLLRKTGLFIRSSTQLAGPRQLEWALEVGVRYLFRLNE